VRVTGRGERGYGGGRRAQIKPFQNAMPSHRIGNAPLVPVERGSTAARTIDVPGFRISLAHFPGHGYIDTHAHDRTCVAIMLRGSFELRLSGRPALDCTPGTMTVEPVGDSHCNCVGAAGAEVLVIQPDPEARDLLAPVARFLDGVRQIRFAGAETAAGRLACEVAAPDDLSPLVAEGAALDLLANGARQERLAATTTMPWMSRLEERLREHVGTAPTLGELAADCEVHPAHLSKAFRARHRCSVGVYLRRVRVERAARLLVESDRPIAQIALTSGFADQSHLTRLFRSHLGTTPSAWRVARRPFGTASA
jgi:AraC family transcriptional regulator